MLIAFFFSGRQLEIVGLNETVANNAPRNHGTRLTLPQHRQRSAARVISEIKRIVVAGHRRTNRAKDPYIALSSFTP